MKVRIASAITIRSGVITSRIETASRSRRISFIAIRFSTSRWTSPNTRSSGSETSKNVARQRPRGGQQLALAPEHLVQPPLRDVGEREQPQRLAGRGAVDDHHVPVALLDVALELQQAEQLVAARRDGQLLGRDPVDALVDEQRAEPALHRRPVALELVLGLHLLGPQVVGDLRRLGADRRLQRLRERVGGVGGQHDRALPGGGAAARGGGRDGGLPDPALARVEDRPRPQRAALALLGFKTSIVPSAVPTLPARSTAVTVTS